MFSSLWIPLALAEVTSQIHFITEIDTASHDAQGTKKRIDNVFIASCLVTNLIRSALWVARLENAIEWDSVWAFQHLYFGVEGMTLLNIVYTASLSNLAKDQNQEKVHIYLLGFELLTIPLTRPIAQYVFFYCPRSSFASSSSTYTTAVLYCGAHHMIRLYILSRGTSIG